MSESLFLQALNSRRCGTSCISLPFKSKSIAHPFVHVPVALRWQQTAKYVQTELACRRLPIDCSSHAAFRGEMAFASWEYVTPSANSARQIKSRLTSGDARSSIATRD